MSSFNGSWPLGHLVRRGRVVVVGAVMVLALAACQPGLVAPIAGNGTSGTSGDTGPAVAAQFQTPNAVVAIPGGGLYVVDSGACVIRKVAATGVVTTVAGTAGSCFSAGDGGLATAATISPEVHGHGIEAALSLDSAGNLYFEDYVGGGYAVRRITPGGAISTVTAPDPHLQDAVVAPDGTIFASHLIFNDLGEFGSADVVKYDALGAQVASWPVANDTTNLAFISSNALALATYHGGVSRLDLTTGVVTPAATISTSDFNSSVAAAPDGTIYVGTNNTVSRVDPDNTVTRIAGNPGAGTADPGTSAQFGPGTSLLLSPVGLALTPNHGLLISSGHVVYRLGYPATAG